MALLASAAGCALSPAVAPSPERVMQGLDAPRRRRSRRCGTLTHRPLPPAPLITHDMVTAEVQRLHKEAPGPVSPRGDWPLRRRPPALARLGRALVRRACCCGRRCTGTSPARRRRSSTCWRPSPARLDAARRRLLETLTLDIVPMLNPDGAQRYQRRNAQGIDINRDALRAADARGAGAEGTARPAVARRSASTCTTRTGGRRPGGRRSPRRCRCWPWPSTRPAPRAPDAS